MLQFFHVDVAKVDRDIAYVAMVVHVCCKRLSPMFHLFFVHVCCKCFRRMSLSVSYVLFVYVASVASGCLKVDRDVTHVAMVFQLYVTNVSSVLDVCCKCFILML